MAVYSPSGSGNVHPDRMSKKVSVGFPQGKTKKVVKKTAKKATKKASGGY